MNVSDVPPGYSLEFSGILIAVLSWVRLMNLKIITFACVYVYMLVHVYIMYNIIFT